MYKAKLTGILVVSSLMAVACGAPVEGESGSGHEQQEDVPLATRMPGGDASAERGISSWDISEESTIGYSENGEKVVEFRLDVETQSVHAVWPDEGARPFGEFGTRGTMAEATAASLDALLTDLEARLEEVPPPQTSEDVVDKAVYGCYLGYAECDYWGFYGVYYGWWIGYVCQIPTQTCGSYWALLY